MPDTHPDDAAWCDYSVSDDARDVADSPERLGVLAVDLAAGAAAEVRSRLGERAEVSSKTTSTDLVTAADRHVEQWLADRLARSRPADSILGEEGGGRPGSSGVRWILDPIDGTVNFVLGLPQFAVSVAAEVNGVVVAGAVANPMSGELFRATLGGGAWLGDTRLRGPREVPLDRAVVGTGFGYESARRARQIAVVARLLPRIADIRRLGAASLDLCAVAAGRLDAYFEAGLNPWDYAAGALVAAEAGCVVTGLRGRPFDDRMTVAAGNASAALIALLEDLDADEVLER
ncbi:MAG: monophosphatase [Pseudonocardiales bacterium]|jgi:myo-inositol-1(or 4)-monophosphatase|nr:monophosphatase [Pseudonocardiales bacterium]